MNCEVNGFHFGKGWDHGNLFDGLRSYQASGLDADTERLMRYFASIAPDILEATAAALTTPVAGITPVIRGLAEYISASAEECAEADFG